MWGTLLVSIELESIKSEIEELREELNTYIEYPNIFKDELILSSKKIDELINKYMTLEKVTQ
jgi:hypothetical protein